MRFLTYGVYIVLYKYYKDVFFFIKCRTNKNGYHFFTAKNKKERFFVVESISENLRRQPFSKKKKKIISPKILQYYHNGKSHTHSPKNKLLFFDFPIPTYTLGKTFQ